MSLKNFLKLKALAGIDRDIYSSAKWSCREENRTIMNVVRAILNERNVPKVFWPEAVKWCVHVQNRNPTFAVENRTPEEAWSNMKPSVNNFRIFGCVSHVHVPDQKRSKLDDRSKICILLGGKR